MYSFRFPPVTGHSKGKTYFSISNTNYTSIIMEKGMPNA